MLLFLFASLSVFLSLGLHDVSKKKFLVKGQGLLAPGSDGTEFAK